MAGDDTALAPGATAGGVVVHDTTLSEAPDHRTVPAGGGRLIAVSSMTSTAIRTSALVSATKASTCCQWGRARLRPLLQALVAHARCQRRAA